MTTRPELRLSRTDARRIAVRAQLLTAQRPTDLVETVRHLTLLQIDPTAAIAPSADLVAWSRLGFAYDRADLVTALEEHRLVELLGLIRPAEDLALYRDEMLACRAPGAARRPLVGKLDATADRRAGLLRVHALHEDEPLPDGVRADVRDEIEELARWLELDPVGP